MILGILNFTVFIDGFCRYPKAHSLQNDERDYLIVVYYFSKH